MVSEEENVEKHAPDPSDDIFDCSEPDLSKKGDADFMAFSISAKSIEKESKENSIDICDHQTLTIDDLGEDIGQREVTGVRSDNDKERKRYVTPQDFELLKVIGMGAFGKVLQVKNKTSHEVLAMKIISKRILNRRSSYAENINAERDILTKVRHPFIVTMHCSFQTKEKLFIIMDFLAGGELFLRLGREGIFLESTARFYIAEIVLALEHLHSLGIIHRDLKPENLLIGNDGHLCLTDFGLSKDFKWDDDDNRREDAKALTICGTQEYMAPEMMARKGYTKAADWWSLGCIAYEMLAGRPPFESKKGSKDLIRKIMNERIRMPDGSSAAACKLLKGLLNRDASARFGAAKGTMFMVGGTTQIKQLEFFDDLNWTLLEQKEIDPPMPTEVENSEDLRHFYDEFTKMQLPRSVKEMADSDFKPIHCKSEAFRGFSFIQKDFALPDRTEGQLDHYWNNAEQDGESASECASMHGIEGDNKSTSNMKPHLGPTPENAEEPAAKKKRPPRKKKKKGKAQVPGSALKSTSLDTCINEKVIKVQPELVSQNASGNDDSKISQRENPTARVVDNANEPERKKPPTAQEPKWESISHSKKLSTKSPATSQILQKHSLRPTAESSKSNLQSNTAQVSQLSRPRVANSHWATVSSSGSKYATHTSYNAQPSRDWRDHKLHPNPPKKKQPLLSDSKAFPSLGEFPAVGKKVQPSVSKGAQGPWSRSQDNTTNAWSRKR